MSAIFTVFLNQLFAPIIIVFGIAGAFFCRAKWHILITAIVAASSSAIFSYFTGDDQGFNPTTFLISAIAAGLWTGWFYWLRLGKRPKQ